MSEQQTMAQKARSFARMCRSSELERDDFLLLASAFDAMADALHRTDPQTAWKRAHLHAYDYAMRRIDRTEAFRRIVRDGLPRRDAAEFVQLCEHQGGNG